MIGDYRKFHQMTCVLCHLGFLICKIPQVNFGPLEMLNFKKNVPVISLAPSKNALCDVGTMHEAISSFFSVGLFCMYCAGLGHLIIIFVGRNAEDFFY